MYVVNGMYVSEGLDVTRLAVLEDEPDLVGSGLIVFTGPSLGHDETRALAPGAVVLPPVCQGDLSSAWEKYSPKAVVVIDGEFGQSLSVWHKEVLVVLNSGVRVFGASSMGALRAAELQRFGMEGIGVIFRHYAEGFVTADEDVALLHSDAENGWRSLTWPMVNVWATIRHLRDQGLVSRDGCDALQAGADALHFTQRSRTALRQKLLIQGRADAGELVDAFVAHFVDQKKVDAIEAVTTALNLNNVPRPAHDTPLHLYGRIGEAMMVSDTLVPSAGHPLRRYQLVNDVAMHDTDFERLSQRALDRAVVLDYALEAGIEPTPEEVDRESNRFFATIGVSAEDIPAWIAANDFGPGEFERFLTDEARRRHMQRWALDVRLYERNRKIIVDQLRLENRYVDAVKAASRRRQLADARPAIDWPTDSQTLGELLLTHSVAAKWQPPDKLDVLVSDHGYDGWPGMLVALLDATAARKEAASRRERLARVFGIQDAKLSVGTSITEDESRNAARAAHSALESHQLTAVALAFVDLGVADAIASGNSSITAIAEACSASADRMGRFLHASRQAGFVMVDDDAWSLTQVGDVFRSDHQASMAPYARDLRDRSMPAWARLSEVVRGSDPSLNESAFDADLAFSSATWALGADSLIAALIPEDFTGHVVDVGGGLGRTARAIANRCPMATVSILDRPEVVQRASSFVDRERVALHTANSFPGGADFVTMSRVLFTLPDYAALALLSQVRSWVTDDAEVHAIDCIPSETSATGMVDLFNLVRGGGGARSEEQWRALAAAAGFSVVQIDPFLGPFSDIVLHPDPSDTRGDINDRTF